MFFLVWIKVMVSIVLYTERINFWIFSVRKQNRFITYPLKSLTLTLKRTFFNP